MPMEQTQEAVSPYIWVCWWQGEQAMSPIVKECYRRIKEYNQDKKVVLITDENVKSYITFPEYIIEKYNQGIISKTHLSDVLRMELLKKYGGVWMDITLLTFESIPEKFYSYPMFSGHYTYDKFDYNVSKNRWSTYFLVSRYPNNVFYSFMAEFWREYWKNFNEILEYFLLDYAIDFAYRSIPAIKKEIDMIPENGCGKDVWELLHKLPHNYSLETLNRIEKENWMQKLSYKGEKHIQEKAENPDNSIYKKLFL